MRPEWLWLILPGLVLILLLWQQRRQAGSWHSVIAPELLPFLLGTDGRAHSRSLLPLLLPAWLLATLAAAGPSWEKLPQPVHQRQDAMVLVLDLSYSMKAEDLAPSRLDRARQKLLDLLRLRREGLTALIAYAGDAHIVSPLTDDNPTIANLIPALSPDIMPVPGSDPVAAVEQALALLRSAGVGSGHIVLLTDGISQRDTSEILARLHDSGNRLSILGIGTDSGAPIPLPGGGFLNDRSGNIVIPTLQREPLLSLAGRLAGYYSDIRLDDADVEALLEHAQPSSTSELRALDRVADSWDDKGFILVLLVLPVCLALFRRGWLVSLLPLLVLLEPQPARAQSWQDLWLTRDQQGQRALQAGDPARAAELFERRDWAGVAAYESGDFDAATTHF
jgi:Ca-activated chloride channel family protein